MPRFDCVDKTLHVVDGGVWKHAVSQVDDIPCLALHGSEHLTRLGAEGWKGHL